jgi:hypothetical protein
MKILSRYRGRIVALKPTIEINYELMVFFGVDNEQLNRPEGLALFLFVLPALA